MPNPLERAESRTRRNDAAIVVDTKFMAPMGKRALSRRSTFHEDPNDFKAVLEDRLLEPCPHIPVCDNVSEVLGSSSESGTFAKAQLRRNDTASSLSSLHSLQTTSTPRSLSNSTVPRLSPSILPGPGLHPERAARAWPSNIPLEHLLVDRYSALWTGADSGEVFSPGNAVSLASTLPAEILQQIYSYLSPTDFNSARHSCQSWFIHSLCKGLLEIFLRRMGCSDAIKDDQWLDQARSDEDIAKYEWRLSKRISRECALGPSWMGRGIVESANSKYTTKSAFKIASNVDFTELSTHSPGINPVNTIFTVSNCGKFLMAANGNVVFVYELNHSSNNGDIFENDKPGSLRPVTSIICPRRILACSMDTSSQRNAIAILLEGRSGVVCEITALGNDVCSPDSWDEYGEGFLECTKRKRTSESEKGRPYQGTPYRYFGFGNASPTANKSAWQELFRDDGHEGSSSIPRTHHKCAPPVRKESDRGSSASYDRRNTLPMPIEEGTRSMYRNLCSEDDPPRSVAICPQRRCVAFGCSSGIELHWVDALTGQNLNRWFPLTAPSDFLFFLPPRQNIDSAKKLRLISSTAKPTESSAIAERHVGTEFRAPGQEMRRTNPNDRFEAGNYRMNPRTPVGYRRRYTAGRNDTSDHYRAVPLSDGYHILFTDPNTGFLCLGSDAPLGGPTKLLRKIWFQTPEGQGSPVAYAGGSDLSAGIRVVAAFGSGDRVSIWLYSVPGDIFSTSQNEPSIFVGPMMQPGASTKDAKTDWMSWWPDDGLQEWLKIAQNPSPDVFPRSVWPVKIKGQEIGTCSSISDLTIDSGPNMVIWAFGKDGSTTSWTLDNGRGEKTQAYSVARDGSVKETVEVDDSDRSIISEPDVFCMSPDSMDGAGSRRSEIHRSKRRRVMLATPPPEDAVQFDADGDVVMIDIDDARNCESSRWVEEEYLEEIHESRHCVEEEYLEEFVVDGQVMVRKRVRRYEEEECRKRTCVRMEEVTGITRLDLEIR